ncbi:hypothetical protein AMATHDRAFT_186670 [Amanita thiersii Skay4041]|uniref:GSKIP domain-containing protein n=1 Tax=Amanita thiersii Skay4041 TaxID=703135 RepID=A0A2A9P0D9_9AGAR|nr:hypothetical protein AMATHDRAFT_186670 [Amanita thiersii Skay4041]
MFSHPSFFATELQQALLENSPGIRSFTITATSSVHCSASVILLEGQRVDITLRFNGYSLDNSERHSQRAQTTYETVEGLLMDISPLHRQWSETALTKALERLLYAIRAANDKPHSY